MKRGKKKEKKKKKKLGEKIGISIQQKENEWKKHTQINKKKRGGGGRGERCLFVGSRTICERAGVHIS